MHFQLFRKKKRKKSSSRASGKYFSQAAKYAAHARFAIGGNFLPALLDSCAEYRWLITGEITHIFFFVRGTFHTTASTLLFRSHALIARAEPRPIASRVSRRYVSRVMLFEFVPRCILRGSTNGIFRREREREPYTRRLLNNSALLRERKLLARFGTRSCGKRDPTRQPRELRGSIPMHFRDSYTAASLFREAHIARLDGPNSISQRHPSAVSHGFTICGFARCVSRCTFNFSNFISELFLFPIQCFSTMLRLYRYVITDIFRVYSFFLIRSDSAL